MVPACPYTEVPLYIIIISSDETCSWAEVYAEDQRRYVCLHIPSSSVDQPKMCEKHCPHKLSYVLAFESSESQQLSFSPLITHFLAPQCLLCEFKRNRGLILTLLYLYHGLLLHQERVERRV